jgi:hypothetical protein
MTRVGYARRSGTWRSGAVAIVVIAVAAIGLAPSAARAETRYSVAGGCFNLASAASGQLVPGGGQLRFQASDLGSYLLYTPAAQFLAAGGGGSVAPAAQPSPASDWVMDDASGGGFAFSPKSDPSRVLAISGGQLVTVPRSGAGDASRFSVAPSGGCAVFPEAELNATGTPASGPTPYGEVRGLMDGHMHWVNFEYLGGNFHCGRPWSPYGIPAALPDCSSIEGPAGAAAPMQNFLNYGNPVSPHDTTGWPTLASWGHTNLTYEGNYYRWVQRVWMAGERLMVMPVNENRVLCELQASRRNSCDEMDTTRLELDDIHALQNYVDAQAGGPGKGFFQIVTDPFQARRVINEGKLAVVLEMEVSEPFGCRGTDGASSCSQAQVDSELADLYRRGVRSSLLLNKFDNPLTGVRFDSGPVGALINAGNKSSAGSFWSAETCKGPEHDNQIDGGVPSGFLATLISSLGVAPGTAPAYPPAPHCNTRGLTGLGAHTVEAMMNRGMIVNPDHMSQRGVDATLKLAEARHYSGIISPHGWMDPRNWPRIWALGGMAFPNSGTASDFVQEWRTYRPLQTPFFFGWGWGADLGGLAEQGSPPAAGSPHVSYPFKSLDGSVTLNRQRTGQRTFDYNNDGVAHYGLYADWTDEVRSVGGPQIADDLLNGPEAYLEMWERAVGVPATHCLPRKGRLRARGIGAIRLGMDDRTLLQGAGQPLTRHRAWTYCVQGAKASTSRKKGKKKRRKSTGGTTAILTPEGKVALIATTAKSYKARGIHPGDRASALRGRSRRLGKGVWVGKIHKTRVAYVVKGKRIRTIAVVGREARPRKALRAYLKLIPSNGFAPRGGLVLRKSSKKLTAKNAKSLVQGHEPGRVAWYCSLGL